MCSLQLSKGGTLLGALGAKEVLLASHWWPFFISNYVNFDSIKDELEAELEELEGAELEEQLLAPATTAPAAPVYTPSTATASASTAGKQPMRPTAQRTQSTPEEDELAALQAEMAM